MREARTLSRDIEVTAIPYGDRISIRAGATVFITQALGGSFTAMTDRGYMVRIEGKDADAIGEQLEPTPSPQQSAGRSIEELCWDMLKTCYDPEIPVNIVDLGLVYSCDVQELAEDQHKVSVRFTLTAPGCGMGDYLREDIESKLRSIRGVKRDRRPDRLRARLEPEHDVGGRTPAARADVRAE